MDVAIDGECCSTFMDIKRSIFCFRTTPQFLLAHTASLHCTLALEAIKNRVHIKHTRSRLASSVTDLNEYLSGEACELLVLHCEKARSEARVNTLRGLLQELTSRGGIFKTNGEDITDKQTTIRHIATTDKAIETKRDELKRLLASLSMTERKINNVKECLVTVFNNFQKDSSITDTYRGKGIQVDFPKESISTLRQFYEERRERRRNKPDLSMEFDVSDYSFSDAVDSNPRFIDELKIYLKKFNLEKNKKLVLDSGEKIWIFETIQSLISRLHSLWLSVDVSCSLICPAVGVRSLCHLVNDVKTKELLEGVVRELNNAEVKNNVEIDINGMIEQEAELIDKIKKRIAGDLTTLQQSEKTLELGQENLKFWADNELKKYISNNRTVDGKTYKDYEAFYLECLRLNV
ncbi:unnamed protein product [Parnassius apollo]|uniref:(apollo) hypothetical protein n=1 Tax=Parnassius apollo TaxID=110799 RepID=A0A8S3Y6A2_PARAO|nr:unnamed protein product [Parnassius apollo]